MKKTIKIIDLLNKIANDEEVPKKIEYEKNIWKLNTLENTYDNGKCCLFEDYIDKKYVITDVLNDEVEIIEDEEDKKIKEIKELSIRWKNNDIIVNEKIMQEDIDEVFADKINELIKSINELKGKSE